MLTLAETLASRSTCVRRAVGCVLVDVHGRVLSMGHNGVPMNHRHCTAEHPCAGHGFPSGQGLDRCEAIHAEQNALMFCPDVMKIHTCYVTMSPCPHCLKMLLNTSCRLIFSHDIYDQEALTKLWCSDIYVRRDFIQVPR